MAVNIGPEFDRMIERRRVDTVDREERERQEEVKQMQDDEVADYALE